MAHVLRLKLQALHYSRLLSSPALALKLLDARYIPWRCYGESALLKESLTSALNVNDVDGDSKATNGGWDSAKNGDGAEGRVSTESDMDKLSSSIYEKLRAKANIARDENDNGFQTPVDPLTMKESKKSLKQEKWDQVVSTARTLALKKKAKAVAGDNLGLPKTEVKEDQHDFSDLDLPEAEGKSGVSRDPNASSKSSLVLNAFGKCFKQKTSQSQFPHQHKPKDTKPPSFLKSLDSNRTLGLFESLDDNSTSTQREISKNKTVPLFTDVQKHGKFPDRNQQKYKDAMPDGADLKAKCEPDFFTEVATKCEPDFFTEAVEDFSYLQKHGKYPDRTQLKNKDAMPDGVDSKMSKGKDSALPQAAQDGSNPHVWNQSRSKDTTLGMSDHNAKGAPPAPLHVKSPSYVSEATYQPSHNSIQHTGYTVCVHDLPASSNPALIKASMAIHGEVLGFFKKSQNEFFHAYIQFKTEQGMETALAARKLQIGSKSFRIVRVGRVFSSVVRLSRVSVDTREKQLLSICGKFGSIDDIRKRSLGVYDVFYQMKELPNMTTILGSLNEVTLNRFSWIATPAPILHPSVQKEALKSREGQAWHEMQVNQALNRIGSGIDGVSVLFEDLKELTALGKEFSKR